MLENSKSIFNKLFNFFKGLLKNKNGFSKLKKIIVVVLIALVIIIFSSSLTDKKTTNKNSGVKQSLTYSSSAVEYAKSLELRLENVLSGIKGIDNIKVFVSVSEGPRIEYLTEINKTQGENNSQTQESVFEQKVDGNYLPVVVVETLPKINGVLIVAKGVDLKKQTTIANIVSSVLSVSVSKVEVMEGK